MPDYKKIATTFLRQEMINVSLQQPKGYSILLKWKEEHYVGSLQHLVPEYDNEIVMLSKSSTSIVPEFVDAILEIQPDRKQINADETLDLEGRLHVVRKVDNQLMRMTEDQTKYMVDNPSIIQETSYMMN